MQRVELGQMAGKSEKEAWAGWTTALTPYLTPLNRLQKLARYEINSV